MIKYWLKDYDLSFVHFLFPLHALSVSLRYEFYAPYVFFSPYAFRISLVLSSLHSFYFTLLHSHVHNNSLRVRFFFQSYIVRVKFTHMYFRFVLVLSSFHCLCASCFFFSNVHLKHFISIHCLINKMFILVMHC